VSRHFELLKRVAKDDFLSLPAETALILPKVPVASSFQKAPPDVEITKLVQRLFSHTGNGSGPKVVSFSGIMRDDRSAWICARAAEALADRADGSVCLIDANLWSPQLHVQVGVANQTGLAEALTTNGPIRSFAIPLSGEHFLVIPAGLVMPGLHLSMERYRERIAELREGFDYVLISAPALSQETDATFIGQLADGVVLVVDANRTRRETARRAKEQLESAQLKLLGAVLDQRTFPIPEMLYRRL
jgi:Mrp family chromosome partitioning ATPase